MPAVELTKLRLQIARLAQLFGQPEEFYRGLRDFLELYLDRAYRPGTEVSSAPLLPSYRPPALLMRLLELELTSLSLEYPAQALLVADRLWKDTYREPRLLAVLILGQMPLNQAEGVLERLVAWATPDEDRAMLEALLDRGTSRLRQEGADALIDLYADWLLSAGGERRKIGLKAFLPLIKDPRFENLPPLFSALFPLVRTAPADLFTDLSTVLVALAERTPVETAYFLRQVFSSPVAKDTPRLARRVLPVLPATQQESLKASLRTLA